METQDTNSDKFHKIVTINETKLEALIDFGSSGTTVKISTVTSIPLEYNPMTSVRITGYGNIRLLIVVTSLFEFIVNDVSAEIVAHVVADCNQKEELLVGRNFTESLTYSCLEYLHFSR